MKTNNFIKALLTPLFMLVANCSDPIQPAANDLSLGVKKNIAETAWKFNATLTRNNILTLRKEDFMDIPTSVFIKEYLSNFEGEEREVIDNVLNNGFFRVVFGRDANARGLDSNDMQLSALVQKYMLKLSEIIPNTIQSSASSGDLEKDKESVSKTLVEKLNAEEVTLKSDNRLSKIDADILLTALEFHKLTIPSILNSLVAAEKNSSSGRVNWSWGNFWKVVAVVIVTAVAVAVVGAAAGAVWATAQGMIGTSVTAASMTGLYIGAGIGAAGGLVAGTNGYCPNDWFERGVPLVDWTTNCTDFI